MTDFRTTVQELQRPKMLIHAARMGMADYRRDRDLRRLIHISGRAEHPLQDLLHQERRAEEKRRMGDAAYSIAHHVDLLIALMAELRLAPKSVAQ